MDEVMELSKEDASMVREDQAIYQIGRPLIEGVLTIGDIPLAELGGDEWNFGVGGLANLIRKLHARMTGPKIICPAIARGAAFALDSQGDFFFTGSGSGGGGAYGIRLNDDQRMHLGFLLGLLNSKQRSSWLGGRDYRFYRRLRGGVGLVEKSRGAAK